MKQDSELGESLLVGDSSQTQSGKKREKSELEQNVGCVSLCVCCVFGVVVAILVLQILWKDNNADDITNIFNYFNNGSSGGNDSVDNTSQPLVYKGLLIIDVQNDFTDPFTTAVESNDNNRIEKVFTLGSNQKLGLSVFTTNIPDVNHTANYSVGSGVNNFLGKNVKQFIETINQYLEATKDDWHFVGYSIDYHPTNHCSFVDNNEKTTAFIPMTRTDTNDVCWTESGQTQTIWPRHCQQNTDGPLLAPNLPRFVAPFSENTHLIYGETDDSSVTPKTIGYSCSLRELLESPMDCGSDRLREMIRWDDSGNDPITNLFELGADEQTLMGDNLNDVFYVFKGTHPTVDSYSALFGAYDKYNNPTGLQQSLLNAGYYPKNTQITVIGVAYDYCVRFTSNDASELGYNVTMRTNLCAPVNSANISVANMIVDWKAGVVGANNALIDNSVDLKPDNSAVMATLLANMNATAKTKGKIVVPP